ncbi:MAG: four helix bundle protein [Candidatus Kapabacteria bacterium]|nr:four helix bundle protein [Candidatus Kapabacteria bacterium]
MYDKALEFAKYIVILTRNLESDGKEKELIKQILRSGTAIGANVAEAQGSVSEPDYISKMHIAYKELIETHYWLELLTVTGDLNIKEFDKFENLYSELSKILYTILKNIRSKRS